MTKNRVVILTLLLTQILSFGFVRGADPITPPTGGEDTVAFKQSEPARLRKKEVQADDAWTAVKEMPFTNAFHVVVAENPKAALWRSDWSLKPAGEGARIQIQ